MNDRITCPHCGQAIQVSALLSKQAQQEAEQRMTQEKARFEQELQKKRQEYQQAFKNLEGQKQEVAQQKQELEQQIQQEAQKKLEQERRQMQAQIEQEQARFLAQNAEQLRAQKEELEKRLQAAYELKLKEKEMQVERLEKAAQEVQRKAQLTSQQLQGEAQELAIEAYLRENFPQDHIEEVKKGRRGGDCVQIVHDYKLQNCGVICYESKRTQSFNEEWIEKFKEDMREAKAHIGVLVTQVLPKSLDRMGLYQGVYVCTFQEFKGLCGILRQMIIDRAWAQQSQEHRGDKIHELYNYLVGPEFAKEVENALLTFREMQADLEKEKQAMERLWAKRSKQIQKIATITTRTRGSIEGIAGKAIAPIRALELEMGDDF
ncbi:DUF2130 domain-containing protein [Helicobacter cynogastricus]|uniref:DUF2130 domain-containing protein n=1 Tax=Helicobacter cynogastricus TaxID=329937 RepID=UPI000CF03B3B|nr:DUF2130 domain-containing protein [Helicobacter cynogastricus]